MDFTIARLAKSLGLAFQGDGEKTVSKIAAWNDAEPSSLIFIESASKPARSSLPRKFGCIITPRILLQDTWDAIISEQPKVDFSRAAALLLPRRRGTGELHPTAIVAPGAIVAPEVDLGPYVVVGAHARIGRGSILHAGVRVGEQCIIGEECALHPNVVLYPGSILGNRAILHAGVVVGSDGFGYVLDGTTQIKFPQSGCVVIGDDVEIGANTTVDRGSLGITRIGAGSKIDNLVQIAHNVEIGCAVVIAAQTGISGSTIIEDLAVIGGQVGFGDHARVLKGAIIGSKAGVLPGKIVRGGEVYWGVPVRPLREYKRLNALFGRLPEMKAEIDALKEALKKLQQTVESLLNRE